MSPAPLRLIYSDTSTTDETGARAVPRTDTMAAISPTRQIEIDHLYPAREAVAPQFKAALDFLAVACELVDTAARALTEEEPIVVADDAMQQLHARLYDAFCQRELGDGYAGVINACLCAFENARGQPFTLKQILSVSRALRGIRAAPFLTFPDALNFIEEMERAELKVDAPGAEEIADWLSGDVVESVR